MEIRIHTYSTKESNTAAENLYYDHSSEKTKMLRNC